jgi:hypothetical protein
MAAGDRCCGNTLTGLAAAPRSSWTPAFQAIALRLEGGGDKIQKGADARGVTQIPVGQQPENGRQRVNRRTDAYQAWIVVGEVIPKPRSFDSLLHAFQWSN